MEEIDNLFYGHFCPKKEMFEMEFLLAIQISFKGAALKDWIKI